MIPLSYYNRLILMYEIEHMILALYIQNPVIALFGLDMEPPWSLLGAYSELAGVNQASQEGALSFDFCTLL